MSRTLWLLMGAAVVCGFLGCVGVATLLYVFAGGDSDRCVAVSAAKLNEIEEGLEDGLTLRNGHAVQSDAINGAWFVAADIQGPGLNGSGDVAVWGTGSLSTGEYIMSIDAMAAEFSDWGRVEISPRTDGLREARGCAG